MIRCINVVLIPFFNDALHMKRLNKFWMIATLKHVVVIFLVWRQLRKSFTLGIFGPQYSNIVMRQLRNAHAVNSFILKSAPTLLLYTLSLSLSLLRNGELISCIVCLPQSGGMVTSLYPFIILQNGLRKCLHMSRMARLPPSFCLTMWYLGLEFRKP